MTAEQALATAIYRSILDSGREELRRKRAADAARPIGEKRLDIDFYTRAEVGKPIESGSYTRKINGREFLVSWVGAQWAVWLVRWDGRNWKRLRRLTGPIGGSSPALDALYHLSDLSGLERVP